MASKRIEIMDIRQLLQLKNRGLSNRKTAGIIGIHRNSVNPYVCLFNAAEKSYKDLLLLSDKELYTLFRVPVTIQKKEV